VAVVAILSSDRGGQPDAVPSSSTDPTVASTLGEPSTSTDPATSTPAFAGIELQHGDILISGASGIRVARGSEVLGRIVTDPTEFALPAPDGRVVYQAPSESAYPDYWPGNEPIGDPVLLVASPEGTTEVLYAGGASIRMFDVQTVPGVGAGPSVVALRVDALADGTAVHSLLVIPLDGSTPLVLADLPPRVTGATWLGDFFAVAVNEESGSSYILPVGLSGSEVDWPLNPEPRATRDASTRITTLARIGDSSLIAYVRASGGFWEGLADLIIYDTATGQTITSRDVGIPQMIVSALHASNDLLAVSKVYDSRDGSNWSFVHVPTTVYDTRDWHVVSVSVPGAGTYSVVAG